MTRAVMEMMNDMTSKLEEQQDLLKEALVALKDLYRKNRELTEQAEADEAGIRQLQTQNRHWQTLCDDLNGQNEALAKQNRELLSLKGRLTLEEGSASGMSGLNGSGLTDREAPVFSGMTKEELTEALASERRKTRILSELTISLRKLNVRLNEENGMLLALREEAERKYGNAKDEYDKLWIAYERYKGLYETAGLKIRELQKKVCNGTRKACV